MTEYNQIKYKNSTNNKQINPKINNKIQIGYALNNTLYNTKRALRNDYEKERNINQYYYEFDNAYQRQ